MSPFPNTFDLKLISKNHLKVLITDPGIADRFRLELFNTNENTDVYDRGSDKSFPHILRSRFQKPDIDRSPNKLFIQIKLNFAPFKINGEFEPHHLFYRINNFIEKQASKDTLCLFDGVRKLDSERISFFSTIMRLYPLMSGMIVNWKHAHDSAFAKQNPEDFRVFLDLFHVVIDSKSSLRHFQRSELNTHLRLEDIKYSNRISENFKKRIEG